MKGACEECECQPTADFYPPSHKTTGLPPDVCHNNHDECATDRCATARCRPEAAEADNRVVAACEALTQPEREDGYFNGTTGLPAGLHGFKENLTARINGTKGIVIEL